MQAHLLVSSVVALLSGMASSGYSAAFVAVGAGKSARVHVKKTNSVYDRAVQQHTAYMVELAAIRTALAASCSATGAPPLASKKRSADDAQL